MPTFILKVAKDEARYVQWSTVVDNVTGVGGRAEILAELTRDIPPGYSPNPGNAPEDRLRRADETGTTARWPSADDPFGGWNDEYLMVEQRGLLPRAKLAEYIDALTADDEATAYALLRPFDDD